jgi:hypothetical protein
MLLMLASVTGFASEPLEPFKATYAVSYRGIGAGSITLELKRVGEGEYVYRSTVDPSALASMIVSDEAIETTRFRLTDQGIQPIEWRLEDGKRSTEDDGALTFDSKLGRVRGVVEDQQIDLPYEPGLQDRLSMQIEVIRALRQGQEPGEIRLIDDEKVKHYTYTRGTTAQIKTDAGTHNAILYESTRPGSKRVSRVWHAPGLGFVPVRAEQVRKGKVETVMTLASIERPTS